MAIIPAIVRAQEAGYPIIVIPTGKGSYTFPQGYQTPWDKIEIKVTEKLSPNLFVLHGSQSLDQAHPDASDALGTQPDGGRQHQTRAIGLEQIDRADVGLEPAPNQLHEIGQRFGRAPAQRDEPADLFEGPQQRPFRCSHGLFTLTARRERCPR